MSIKDKCNPAMFWWSQSYCDMDEEDFVYYGFLQGM